MAPIKGFYENQCCAITHHLPIVFPLVHQGHIINLDNAKVVSLYSVYSTGSPYFLLTKRYNVPHLSTWDNDPVVVRERSVLATGTPTQVPPPTAPSYQ